MVLRFCFNNNQNTSFFYTGGSQREAETMVMKGRDEELALFLEMRRREKENEKNNLLLLQKNSAELDRSNLESNRGSSPVSKMVSSALPRKTGSEEFLNSENEKSDYEWLISPPGPPLFPTLEESQILVKSEKESPNARSTALKPRLANIQSEPASRSNITSKHQAAMPGLGSSTTGNRRPSSSGVPTSATFRSVTSSGRPTLPSTTKSSRPSTPTSRATVTSAKPAAPPVRSSTPTSRSTTRPSTPTSRSTTRASTPTSRPSLAAPKTNRRSSTPTLRSSTPSSTPPVVSAPPGRSSSATKARPTNAKNPVQSRGSSPSVKSRPKEPSQMPGFSLDAPPNLMTERPASTSRSRPGAPSSRSSSLEASSNGKSKRQSGTPSKGRASTGTAQSNQSTIQALSKSRFIDCDNESPVVIGTKMVERVVNMRKLALPKHENHHSANSSSGKSSLSESSGFGRTLSKKSLDMAMRHMDIRRSIQSNLRPLVTSIPASSMYSVRSTGSSNSRTVSVSDSPLTTSSTASSEPSLNTNSICYDIGSEIEENDYGSETGNSSPTSHHTR